jgi:hypothetical protein
LLPLNLDSATGHGSRRQRLQVWRKGDRRKTDFVILPRRRLAPASEDAYARLSPPNRKQIAVNIMSSSNLDNAGPRHSPRRSEASAQGPPPSPLWTGQNRNRRHVCSFAGKFEQTISRSDVI